MRYIYGVGKYGGEWVVWRFGKDSCDQAVQWVLNGVAFGEDRWLCSRQTASAMAGEQAMELDNIVIWED